MGYFEERKRKREADKAGQRAAKGSSSTGSYSYNVTDPINPLHATSYGYTGFTSGSSASEDCGGSASGGYGSDSSSYDSGSSSSSSDCGGSY